MAEAIPRSDWTEAEEYRERLFYWEFLVNTWLLSSPGVLKESPGPDADGAPRTPALSDYGWLLEPDHLLEQ